MIGLQPLEPDTFEFVRADPTGRYGRRLQSWFTREKTESWFADNVIVKLKKKAGLFNHKGNGNVGRSSREGPSLYATILVGNTEVGRTGISENDPVNPSWNDSFHIYCAYDAADVIITINDDNKSEETLGTAYIPVRELLGGQEVDKWFRIWDNHDRLLHGDASIHIKLHYTDITRDENWSQGITSKFTGVPCTFFRQREGCKVTLYQDCHVPDHFNPRITLDWGEYYEAKQRCWEDIFDAITNARHLIYISGWSLYTEITLIRDPRRQKPGGGVTLGELLRRKARGGVRVLILAWDEISSWFSFKRKGFMDTHCNETADFFRGTFVHCVLSTRRVNVQEQLIEGAARAVVYSHHQKTLVVDSEAMSSQKHKRRIVSFVGGIDLTQGRYDTQSHSLFGTLNPNDPHHNDFYQPSFSSSSIQKGGPRQPWHDIHCRLEGPVAWDVLSNFEERWKKELGKDDLLLDHSNIIDPPTPVPKDRETWNAQLFRSIDGEAVKLDEQLFESQVGLVRVKNNIVDRSIHDAYINAIRRAKDFIYIENQFFIGSSFGWNTADTEGHYSLNLVPKELSLKIVSKIEAGQRFTAYIVLPMRPEGNQESVHEQAILYLQRRTMDMMYSDITKALLRNGLNASPKEYLSFFCLANQEVKKSGEYIPTENLNLRTEGGYIRAQQARRFMIYVHSKMMIVDDEYIIIGSANINQRSMDGRRDTEIAMGAFQPFHLGTRQPARGQIHGFRMALWYEHLGMLDDSFLYPQSVECIRKVNEIADKNWELYSSNNPPERDLPSHLVSYPIKVTESGSVNPFPGMEFFPDTNLPILGKFDIRGYVPDSITRFLPDSISSSGDSALAMATT
ncbi:phospholipase D alpha 1-like protein [Cinnamomum micranthum f. kanehirae]|uniref:Phospholipase D n=1 Tax=Cinnamomum micranthum f. kanehirae TaxID=337451 RepID=A0A443N1S2_9MAGN|nr:phospholipase D alpha 1-like protein [Cinnamomum micranthum f. kanehirae]